MVILIFKDVSYFIYKTDVWELNSTAALFWNQIMKYFDYIRKEDHHTILQNLQRN